MTDKPATLALWASWTAICFSMGCEPTLKVGKWDCSSSASNGGAGAPNGPDATTPVAIPWTTGFEDGFCGYLNAGGFCYSNDQATYALVTSPVHSGSSAASFSVAGTPEQRQARCVRHGALPSAAYYTAWYYVPAESSGTKDWNLFHFQGGSGPDTSLDDLWDVSLAGQSDGSFQLYAYDFLRMMTRATSNVPSVPIRSWFKVEVYLKRAADNTGEFRLYQDDQLALELTNLVTDNTQYGQWYVGNLALSTPAPEATLFVDDVSIQASR